MLQEMQECCVLNVVPQVIEVLRMITQLAVYLGNVNVSVSNKIASI
jgi:hypothetical protein